VQLGDQFGPGLGVGAVDLDIHDRFAPMGLVAARLDLDEAALFVAPHADDRVEQPVDDQSAPGDRACDRIDQEGHVVIGDADPHPPLAEPCACGFEADQSDAGRAARGAGGDELGGRAAILGAEIVELAGQRPAAQQRAEIVQQAPVSGLARADAVRTHKLSRGFGRGYSSGLADAATYSTTISPVMPKLLWRVWVQRR
jgi:hypothetical protein